MGWRKDDHISNDTLALYTRIIKATCRDEMFKSLWYSNNQRKRDLKC